MALRGLALPTDPTLSDSFNELYEPCGGECLPPPSGLYSLDDEALGSVSYFFHLMRHPKWTGSLRRSRDLSFLGSCPDGLTTSRVDSPARPLPRID